MLPLLERPTEEDGIASEKRGEYAGRDADIDRGQLLAHAVDVHGIAAHAPELRVNEQQRDAKAVAAHLTDNALGELVGGVELPQLGVGQMSACVLPDGVERHVELVAIQAGGLDRISCQLHPIDRALATTGKRGPFVPASSALSCLLLCASVSVRSRRIARRCAPPTRVTDLLVVDTQPLDAVTRL